MKENNCCQKFRGNTSVMSTEKEFMVEKLMAELKIPAVKTPKVSENLGTKIKFTKGVCEQDCSQYEECSFCLVDFLSKE